jgi:photosystem II stability/assembly factor-like uncharacterized protein
MMGINRFVSKSTLLCLICYSGFALKAQWKVVQTGVDKDLSSISVDGFGKMYACGFAGKIIQSSDSGKTWSKLNFPGFDNFSSIKFYDSLSGYVCSYNGTMYKTVNGGLIWNQLYSDGSNSIYDVAFYNNQYGVMTGSNGMIAYTKNNGLSWEVYTAIDNRTMYSVAVSNSGDFVIVGDIGTIYKTDTAFEEFKFHYIGSNTRLNKIRFTQDKAFVIAGGIVDTTMSGSYNNILAVSTDTGITWQKNFLTGERPFYSLWFLNKDSGYMAMSSGLIANTKNGGDDIGLHYIGNPSSISDLYFFDFDKGIGTISNGRVILTENGGGFGLNLNEIANDERKLIVYPNPSFDGIINWSFTDLYGSLIITDINGRVVSKEVINSHLHNTKFHSGVYFYQYIDMNNKTLSGKLVVY